MAIKRAHASHILIASKSQAIQIVEKITAARKPHKEFQKMARKHSSCPSGSKGGDLGWFHYKQMVPDFSKKVWEQDLKAIDGFIKTGFGYHIIWVHERDE
jgi:peptidyl-prolyl cis-trans isomerase C